MRSRFVFGLVGLAFVAAACGGGGGGGGGPTPTGPITFAIAGIPAGPLSPNTTYAISASETQGGSPLTPGTLTVKLDNAAVGTLTGTTLVAGLASASGHLTVTDASHNLSATTTVSVGATHPDASGDAVTLAGSFTQTITRPIPVASSVPPPSTTNATIAIATTTTTGATFNGRGGLTDFKSVETDTTLSPVIATTTTTDAYQNVVANGAAFDVVTAGNKATDSNGNTFTTIYGVGNGLLDVLPETDGGSFSNNAALTYAESDAGGASATRTVNGDGSYIETDTFADSTSSPQKITVAPDLSGGITDLRGQGASNGLVAASVAVAAPVPEPSGRPGSVINYTLTSPAISPTTQTLPIPDWYPTTALASDTVTSQTGGTIPTACAAAAAVGTSATVLSERSTRLDPVLGTFEARTTTTYLAPFYGIACVTIADKLDDYYDYSRQVGQVVGLADVPIQTTVTSETIALKAASVTGAPVVAASRARDVAASSSHAVAGAANVQPSFAAARASFDRVIARAYARRRSSLRAALAHALSVQKVIR